MVYKFVLTPLTTFVELDTTVLYYFFIYIKEKKKRQK